MKKARSTGEQIVAAARKHQVSEGSIHRRRKQYAGMETSEVRVLKRLKNENARLKTRLRPSMNDHLVSVR